MSTESAARTNKDEEVQTVTESGSVAKKRIATAKAAHSLAKKLKKNDVSNALARARLNTIYDGNPPFSTAELKRRGLGWMMNVDWGEFRSTINRNTTSIWNMFNSTEHLISCSTMFKNPQEPGVDYGTIVANEFSEIVRSWDNYNFVSMSMFHSLVKIGIGLLMWPDTTDWRPRTVIDGCFFVPSKTKSSPGSIFTAVVYDEMYPSEAFSIIAGGDSSKDLGWNLTALKKRLVAQYLDGKVYGEGDDPNSDWESYQSQIATKVDPMDEEDLEPLRIVHLYSVELEGPDNQKPGVTHQIIVEADDEDEDFIFEKENRFKSMSEVIHVMLYTIGNGKMQSVRGLGREIYYASHASNRMLNNIINGVTISSGVMLKPNGEVSRESTRLVRHGVVTVLPQNADIIQQQFHPNIKASAEVRNLINSVVANSKAGYKEQEDGGQAGRTAREAEIIAQESASLEQDHAEWLYSQYRSLMQEMFRRLMNPDYPKEAEGYEDHKEFVDNLKARGVPDALLDPDQWRIKVPKAVGLGNRSMAMGLTNQAVKMKGSLDEDGRREVDRMWFGVRFGWDQVDKFVPLRPRDEIFTVGHAMAEGENIDMQQGFQRQVAVDDPHMIHYTMHMKSAATDLQLAMSGQKDPAVVMQSINSHVPHIGAHVAQMSLDETRTQQVKDATQALRKLIAASKELEQMVKQQQAQQQKEQEEIQRQLQENQQKDVDIALGQYKIDREMELRAIDTENQNANRNAKTIAKIEGDFRELEAKLNIMLAESSAKRQTQEVSSGESS